MQNSPLCADARAPGHPSGCYLKVMWNTDIIFKHGYLIKKPIELSTKKSAYSVYVYGALDVRLFPNKRLNVDLKNIEIWVSHGLNVHNYQIVVIFFKGEGSNKKNTYIIVDVLDTYIYCLSSGN